MACKTDGRNACVLWLALLGTALAAPLSTALAAPVSTTVAAPVSTPESAPKSAAAAAQHLRVSDVRIEGKVYSPQALFIVSRPADRFDHAVVPRYLQLDASKNLLPYRLRPEVLDTHRAAPEGTSATQARP